MDFIKSPTILLGIGIFVLLHLIATILPEKTGKYVNYVNIIVHVLFLIPMLNAQISIEECVLIYMLSLFFYTIFNLLMYRIFPGRYHIADEDDELQCDIVSLESGQRHASDNSGLMLNDSESTAYILEPVYTDAFTYESSPVYITDDEQNEQLDTSDDVELEIADDIVGLQCDGDDNEFSFTEDSNASIGVYEDIPNPDDVYVESAEVEITVDSEEIIAITDDGLAEAVVLDSLELDNSLYDNTEIEIVSELDSQHEEIQVEVVGELDSDDEVEIEIVTDEIPDEDISLDNIVVLDDLTDGENAVEIDIELDVSCDTDEGGDES